MTEATGPAGFTFVELLLVMALGVVLLGAAVPIANQAGEGMRLGLATREVARSLQIARLRAVSTNRPIRVRLNCPGAGQLRVVEVTGVDATDQDGARCDERRFPYPAARDSDPATPAHDGPVRTLDGAVMLTGPDIQFSPDGSAQEVRSGSVRSITTPVRLMVARYGATSTLEVNGLGKIEIL